MEYDDRLEFPAIPKLFKAFTCYSCGKKGCRFHKEIGQLNCYYHPGFFLVDKQVWSGCGCSWGSMGCQRRDHMEKYPHHMFIIMYRKQMERLKQKNGEDFEIDDRLHIILTKEESKECDGLNKDMCAFIRDTFDQCRKGWVKGEFMRCLKLEVSTKRKRNP